MKKRQLFLVAALGLGSLHPAFAQRAVQRPRADIPFKDQDYQRPEKCLPCHQRQYDELRSSVKSGYRSVSPLFNGLELSGNLLNGGLLRPVYADSTKILPDGVKLNTNAFTTAPVITEIRQLQAGLCFSCHDLHVERRGDDPSKREVPELAGVGANFRPDLVRPLRDYHLVDANGNQVLPDVIGGNPPPGASASLGARAITCDVCHNVSGPDLDRSVRHDGFANFSIKVDHTIEKVGPFAFPVGVKDNFHVASNDPDKIAFLRSGAFCNACHDVRLPSGGEGPGDLQHFEVNSNPGGEKLTFFRLENLSTEWQTGKYNSTDNPFGKVVRCQDCHMSKFPFGGNSTYKVGDLNITSATPGVFADNYAAVPGISTDAGFPLPLRKVVNHNFTGVDVPLLSVDQLRARLDPGYPDPYETGVDEYGIPKALATRRDNVLKNAIRVGLDKTDARAKVGQEFEVKVEAVSLTGHRFPAGFSQERTGYIELTVKDANGFVVYQSGYQVDKPHPDTGEMAPDGSLEDEDLEHVRAVVSAGKHVDVYVPGAGPNANGATNLVFDLGPDDGPDARVYAGVPEGLVLFRNELTKIFLPGQSIGRDDEQGNTIVATRPHYEETFNAAFANTVDNFRSLQPLVPHEYKYKITLPTAAELQEMGVQLKGPLSVHAQVNYEHFPPLFVRYLARLTGPDGPTGHDLHLMNEAQLDQFLKNNRNITSADTTVTLDQ